MTLKVRNWDKWQTYRADRGTPPWIKVHRNIFTNPEWVMLSDAEKGQLVSIWVIAADKSGKIPHSPLLIQKMAMLDTPPNINKFIELGFLSSDCQPLDAKVTPTRRQSDAPETEAETEAETETEKSIVTASSDIVLIFDYWVSITGKQRSKLDKKRTKQIRDAIKLGYTTEQLKMAIDGNHRSSWHQGNNDRRMIYDSIDLIFRNADQIDKFIQIANGTGKDWKQDTVDRLSWVDDMDFGTNEKEVNPQ